jgi:metal-responsive CopG/Arc/MetJ family transcriptional regulator
MFRIRKQKDFSKMKRTTIFLTEELLARVEKHMEKTGARMAEIIRRALTEYLDKYKS